MEKALAFVSTRPGFRLASGLLLLAAFLLRGWRLGSYDLWLDEGISYFIANRSPLAIIQYTAQNISEHPPGYYFGLHFWMQVAGASEFSLRFFSVLGGLLYIALAIMLARRWFGERLALLVGALLCVQPLSLTLGRDARMYTWYGVAVLLLLYFFDRAIHGDRARNWVIFGLAALVALAINYLAVFVLVALMVFAILRGRDFRRRLLPFGMVLLVVLGLPLLWVVFSPGPRGSLGILLDTLRTPWSATRLTGLYFGFPLSSAADNGQSLDLWLLAGLRWLLALIGIVAAATPRMWPRRAFQWFLLLLILVPPLAASLMFPVVKQRFFSATVGVFVLAVALGLGACWRWLKPLGPVLATALVLVIVILDGQYVAGQIRGEWRPFSPPLNHILDRARPGEPIIYTYPWDRFLDLYYNAGRQPVSFAPASETPATPEMAVASAAAALSQTGSAWLVMYPSAFSPEVVQQGFDRGGYPGAVRWFDGGRGVIHYFQEQPVAEQPGGFVWADRIALERWSSSVATVYAGDALRFEFLWRAVGATGDSLQEENGPSELFELSLAGADGQTWATRIAAPCNGQCPLSKWGGEAVQERQAFYVPADVPPGRYTVSARWLDSTGEPMLARRVSDAAAPQSFVQLMDVEVLPPAVGVRETPLDRIVGATTDDGSLRLESITPLDTASPGGRIVLPMQFSVQGALRPLQVRLILGGNGPDEVLSQPLGPAWYSSEAWTPGRLVRVQPSFVLPPGVQPGTHDVAIELAAADSAEPVLHVQAGSLMVRDRERRYDLPVLGEPAGVDWQEGIHLASVAAPTEVTAGQPMTVTLVWQADRPTAGNWKVFVHLVDADGVVVGQGDDYPAGGAALTPTWKHGEVVIDEHRIDLLQDLAPGEHLLRIGFYNEATDERLPLGPGVDTFTWTQPVRVKQP